MPRHCWIKADPTFEGLKQILYEPGERVRIQQDDPTAVRSNFTIQRVSLSVTKINRDLGIGETNIPLNSGLVAVTGSRGSGKTAFVDLIANCYDDRSSEKDRNSFVWRILDDKPAIQTTLTFRDGRAFSKKLLDGAFFEESELVYIAQGELERYIDDKSDFEQHVRRLILENPEVQNSVKGFEYEELCTKLESIRGQLKAKNEQITTLETKTSSSTTQGLALEKKQKEAELRDVRARIEEVEKLLKPERVKEAQEKQQTLATLKTKKEVLFEVQGFLRKAIEFLDTDLPAFNRLLEIIRSSYTKVGVTEALEILEYHDQPKLKARLTAVGTEMRNVVEQIEKVQQGIDQHAAEVRDHTKLLDRRTEIERVLVAIKQKEDTLAADKEVLAKALDERGALLKVQIQSAIDRAKKYQELIDLFSNRKTDVLGDFTFEAGVTFNMQRFLQGAEDVLDNRKARVHPDNGEASEFENLLGIVSEISKNGEVAIARYGGEIEKINERCRSKIKRSEAISISDFYDFLFGDYFSVSAAVKYKNTELRKLSLGQKATVLIKIHLAQGDKPIIIDSHDDHLDNEFIMEELVKTLRYAKQYRQIILASNNGNVVINSDADQIIVARRDRKGEISYAAGSIENPDIRDVAIRVLEGGEAAFRQRQQKYRLGS